MTIQLVKLWIWISALATAAGWLLSALGALNPAGYAIFTVVALALIWLGRKPLDLDLHAVLPSWKKLKRRFRRPLPIVFALLAILIFIGGALYPPTNHTALSYRLPRVLQWLAHERWFWIHTPNFRMNDRACGIEWLTAPLLLFTRSDRALFLLNFFPFLLLPGLIFSFWTRLGVRPRVAWQWMWLLPTGYTFLLQAGSAGNDTFPTVYALAALDFGCRAWKRGRVSDVWHSFLAAALLTGAKASNLPLLLPWAILIFPSLKTMLRATHHASRGRIATVLVLLLCAVVSFLPTAILNWKYCGTWSGLNLERTGMDMKNPLVGIQGNAFQLLLDNFLPPFFPAAGWWNQNALSLLPGFIVRPLSANFEEGFHEVLEMPTEDWAGLGFGVSVLLTTSVLMAWRYRARITHHASRITDAIPPGLARLVLIASWFALLVYCMKSGMVTAARLISPYYPLLIPLLLAGAGSAEVIRRRWWRLLVSGNLVLAFAVLVLTPMRPLWPAKTILSKAIQWKPEQRLLARAEKVYAVFGRRSDPLADVRALLPPGLRVVGFMGTPDDLDISLWRPYGTRRVEHILAEDSAADIRQRGLEYAVIGGFNLQEKGTTLDAWLQRADARVIGMTSATIKITEGPQAWYIVRFK